MKTKKFNLKKENLQKSLPNIIWIIVFAALITLCLVGIISYNKNIPPEIKIDLSHFGGEIVHVSESSGFSLVGKVNAPFEEGIRWGVDAILVYGDSYYPDIQIYKALPQVCGAFQYATYRVTWKEMWYTKRIVYDNTHRTLICSPGFSSTPWVFAVIVIVLLGVFMIINIGSLLTKLGNK